MTRDEIEAIAQRPTYCKADGEAVTLSRAERDALVAMARASLKGQVELPEIDQPDNEGWGKTDSATAFHIIDREADSWAHVGVLMERWARAWVESNPAKEPS